MNIDNLKFPATALLAFMIVVTLIDYYATGGYGTFTRIVDYGGLGLFTLFAGYAWHNTLTKK